jgi:hypothetical protein
MWAQPTSGSGTDCFAPLSFAEMGYHRRADAEGDHGDHNASRSGDAGPRGSEGKYVMSKLAIAVVVATVIGSPALAQSFDPHLGSGNLGTVDAGVTYLPPTPSGACEVRRMQFSDAFGWRVRDVLVCCAQGRCTSRLTY